MALLHGIDTETTTLLHVIQAAEEGEADQFDIVHLSLDSGRDLILVAIVGGNLDATGRVLQGLRELREV